MTPEAFKAAVAEGIPVSLPPEQPYDPSLNHAPKRRGILNREEKKLALRNALRYIPAEHHPILSKEFVAELEAYGRIYMYRYKPVYRIYSRTIDAFPHRSVQAAAIMLMLSNNLDHAVAQHPDLRGDSCDPGREGIPCEHAV